MQTAKRFAISARAADPPQPRHRRSRPKSIPLHFLGVFQQPARKSHLRFRKVFALEKSRPGASLMRRNGITFFGEPALDAAGLRGYQFCWHALSSNFNVDIAHSRRADLIVSSAGHKPPSSDGKRL